ncbi:hypothetical protein Tco_0707532 [Tanacetum coccineum]|uniref:Uncharacterized protein n=1 Tax=Tanacetum coccineum TaxID=301880 RepID=A0ABQ4YBI7_9ASTR
MIYMPIRSYSLLRHALSPISLNLLYYRRATPRLSHEGSLSPAICSSVSLLGSLSNDHKSSLSDHYGESILCKVDGGDNGSGGGGDGGGGGSDGDLHLLRDTEGEGEGDGDGDDGVDDCDGDMYLLQGGATISSMITASMVGGRVNGGRTVFLGPHIWLTISIRSWSITYDGRSSNDSEAVSDIGANSSTVVGKAAPLASESVVRYHSLVIDPKSLLKELIPLAWTYSIKISSLREQKSDHDAYDNQLIQETYHTSLSKEFKN